MTRAVHPVHERALDAVTGLSPRPPVVVIGVALALAAVGFHQEGLVRFDATGREALRAWVVIGLWLASIALFLLGAARLAPSRSQGRRVLLPTRAEVVAFASIVVIAVAARVVALDRVPNTVSGDEAGLGLFSREVLEGRWGDPFTTGLWSHPSLWFYLQAGGLRLFGDDLVGLRLVTALIGVGTVVALYLFARPLYGVRIAVVSAALLATYHFHIHFSRTGLNQAIEPLFMLIGFGLLLAGWRAQSPLLLASAGISIGVAQNFYYGTRLEFVVLTVVLAHQLVAARQTLVAVARYLPLVALGVVIGWGPGMRVPLDQWNDYTARLAITGIFESGWFESRQALGASAGSILLDQVLRSAGAFSFTPDRGPHYVAGVPLLDAVSSVLFVLGLCIVLGKWRRPESGLILGVLVGTVVFGGVLLTNPPEFQRFVTLAPVVCLLIALGLDGLSRASSWAFPLARPLVQPLASLVVAGLAIWSVNFYFRDYSPRNAVGLGTTEAATAMGRYLAERPGHYTYFVGAPFIYLGDPSIRFIARNPRGTDVMNVSERGRALLPSPSMFAPLVLVYSARIGEVDEIRRRHPGTPLQLHRSTVDDRLLFATYEPFSHAWSSTGRR